MKTTLKTIEIAGYAKETVTAIWTGSRMEEVTDFNPQDYEFEEKDLLEELNKCQKFIDNQVKENNWVIEPKAFINEYEF